MSAPKFDPHTHAETMASAMGLTIEPAWMKTVEDNLTLLHTTAQIVLAHPIDDDTESALTFSAHDKSTHER